MSQQELLLIGAVVAVGVLHTLVPDHWVPITFVARQQQWTRTQTARAALIAGLGHTLSTLLIGAVVWLAGLAVAVRFGHLVSTLSSVALIAFGAWIAIASLREVHSDIEHHHDHGHDDGLEHRARPGLRMTLLLILGSSPMVEGIPAFFAAAKFGAALIVLMSLCFALSTIATYVILCVFSDRALRRVSLGPLERYGEVLSGTVIAAVGIIFMIWPLT